MTRSEWGFALLPLLAVFAITRLLVILVAITVDAVTPQSADRDVGDSRPVLASLTTSDAVYYLGIATDGYHQQPIKQNYRDWVFFPACPAAIKVVSMAMFGDVALAAVLVSNLAFSERCWRSTRNPDAISIAERRCGR